MIKTATELRAAIHKQSILEARLERKAGALQQAGVNEAFLKEQIEELEELRELREDIQWFNSAVNGERLPSITKLKDIGRLLIALRLANGLSQLELAKLLGVSTVQVSRDERKNYAGISVERAERILAALSTKICLAVDYEQKEPGAKGESDAAAVIRPVAMVEPEMRSTTINLSLSIATKNPQSTPITHPKLCRENIERLVLSKFSMNRVAEHQAFMRSSAEYQLIFTHRDAAELDKQIQEMLAECQQEAKKLKCFTETDLKEL